MQRPSFFALLLFCLAASLPAQAQFPREGIVEIPNGVSAPFAGSWAVGFPAGKGMINGEPLVSCDQPVRLQPAGEHALSYLAPNGSEILFELTAFSGRTTWFPPAGESIIAVWTSSEEFFTYSVTLTNGRARWDDPHVYRRC
jgi:hypothetical protein